MIIKRYDNKKISNKNSPIITFKDLSVLHKYFPEDFKDLAITATEQDTRKLKVFNSKNTPDIEVALACRASASFPIVFKETKINGKNYIDGGFVNNTPQENFDKLPSGRTLALIFADKNNKEAYKIVYSEEPIKEEKQSFFKKISEYVKMFFLNILHPKEAGNIFYNAKNDMMDTKRSNNITNEHIRNNAMNTIILDAGEVTTLDFDKAQRLSLYLHLKGSVAAETYMQNYNLKPRDSTIDFRNFMIDLYEKHYSKILNDNTVDNKQLDPLMNKILDFCENEKWQNHSITDNIKEFKDIVSINNIESKKLNESIKEILDKKDISSVVLKEFNDFYKKENNQNNTIDNQVSNHVQTLIYNRENNIARPDNIRARG
jgi:NTE family protein